MEDHPITRLTAAEATRNFGNVRELAARDPVFVTHHGRDTLAILGIESYQRLAAGGAGGTEAQRRKLLLILDGISEGYASLGPDWRFVTINRVAELFLGQPRAELVGRSWAEAFPPVAGTRIETQLRRAMDHGEEVTFDWDSVIHQGRRIRIHAFPLPMPDGGIGILFSNLSEIERLEAQERLQRSALGHLLTELPGWAMFAHDADGTIVHWTDSIAALLGWPGTQILGQPVDRLLDPADRQAGRPWNEMAAARREGRCEGPTCLLHRDGSRVALRSVTLAPPDCPGHFFRIVSPSTP